MEARDEEIKRETVAVFIECGLWLFTETRKEELRICCLIIDKDQAFTVETFKGKYLPHKVQARYLSDSEDGKKIKILVQNLNVVDKLNGINKANPVLYTLTIRDHVVQGDIHKAILPTEGDVPAEFSVNSQNGISWEFESRKPGFFSKNFTSSGAWDAIWPPKYLKLFDQQKKGKLFLEKAYGSGEWVLNSFAISADKKLLAISTSICGDEAHIETKYNNVFKRRGLQQINIYRITSNSKEPTNLDTIDLNKKILDDSNFRRLVPEEEIPTEKEIFPTKKKVEDRFASWNYRGFLGGFINYYVMSMAMSNAGELIVVSRVSKSYFNFYCHSLSLDESNSKFFDTGVFGDGAFVEGNDISGFLNEEKYFGITLGGGHRLVIFERKAEKSLEWDIKKVIDLNNVKILDPVNEKGMSYQAELAKVVESKEKQQAEKVAAVSSKSILFECTEAQKPSTPSTLPPRSSFGSVRSSSPPMPPVDSSVFGRGLSPRSDLEFVGFTLGEVNDSVRVLPTTLPRSVGLMREPEKEVVPQEEPKFVEYGEIGKDRELIGSTILHAIYKATWNGQTIALKILKVSADSEPHRKKLEDEFTKLKNINCPRIIKTHGFSYDNEGQYCLMLHYYSEGDLGAYVYNPKEPRPKAWIYQRAIEVCEAVDYLHSKRGVHKDIKPENVFLGKDGHAVLGDFGLFDILPNNSTHQLTDSGGRGTYAFMAPELHQADDGQRNSYTTSSDIYSLAILIWCCEVQKKPYEKLGEHQIPAFVLGVPAFAPGVKAVPPRREDIPVKTPRRLADLIQSCWAQERRKRPNISYVLSEMKAIQEECNVDNSAGSTQSQRVKK